MFVFIYLQISFHSLLDQWHRSMIDRHRDRWNLWIQKNYLVVVQSVGDNSVLGVKSSVF